MVAKLKIVIMAAALALAAPASFADQAVLSSEFSQPLNVGDAILAATRYQASGEYQRDLEQVAQKATEWIVQRAPAASRPALVLDIDETALSNWEVIQRDNFGRPIEGPCEPSGVTPCGWAAWDLLAKDPPIEPTLQLYRTAKSLGVAVFFITGRPENQREATQKNLIDAGYNKVEQLIMVPPGFTAASAADFKPPQREEIERRGYTIIANVGDQPSDLFGGHAERLFLLPNPFYRVK